MKHLYSFLLFLMTLSLLLVASPAQVMAQQSEKVILRTDDKKMTVYPTPASTEVYVRLSPSLKGEIEKLEIINLIGSKIAEQPIIDKNITEYRFGNLDEVVKGIYMVVARDKYGKIAQSVKLIVNR